MNVNGNPRNPSYRPYSDEDSAFLFGAPVADMLSIPYDAGRTWKRTLTDAGIEGELNQLDMSLSDLPDDKVAVELFPEKTMIGTISVGLDVPAMLVKQFEDARSGDERFEKASDRWKKAPDRVQGYVPADAGSIRWSLAPHRLLEGLVYDRMHPADIEMRVRDAECAAWAYMGVPHFIPADLALDVVTAEPPDAEARREIRLPHRYVMVFHDGVPVPVVLGDDDRVDAFGDHTVVTDETLVIGALLSADGDGTLFPDAAFLLVARRDPNGWYAWQGVRVPFGDHPAGRVLYNYAALLSWEGWAPPPKLPVSPKGKAGSANQLKKAARTAEAQAGGWHGVHVLDYRPPAPAESKPGGKGTGRPRQYQSVRRAHWTRRTRYGIRDEHDQLIGRVYGPDAVEGQTFVRIRKFIRRSVVREDLPQRPDDLTVYRLPGTARQVSTRGR